jgi:cell wall-associated NlpC family hydrolase
MNYPKRIIKEGETNTGIVKAIQKKLDELGLGPFAGTGVYGSKTKAAVKLYQSMHRDRFGIPLLADGKIGALTWESLFGPDSVVTNDASTSAYLTEVLKVAASQVGVMEVPVGSNKGPEVNAYLASVGVAPGNFWCAGFVYWCFNTAASNMSRKNPLVKTGGCLNHWNKSTAGKILAADAIDNPSLIKPGYIFIINHGAGLGHTGIVESVEGGLLHTIEGNSNPAGSNNGIGVFNITRKINTVNKGYLLYK